MIFVHAFGDAFPKILGMGCFAALTVAGLAIVTYFDRRRIAEKQARRMFAGNRRPNAKQAP